MKNFHKTCFFPKVSKMKPANKANLLPNNKHMGGIKKIIAAAGLSLGVAATPPANAEAIDINNQEQIICTTKNVCQKLSETLQSKINALEAKGLENLTDEEFEKYAQLSDALIATERTETEKNKNLIATENQKQTKLNQKQEQMRLAQDKKIAELRDKLLEK